MEVNNSVGREQGWLYLNSEHSWLSMLLARLPVKPSWETAKLNGKVLVEWYTH